MTSPLDELIRRLDRLERRVNSIETSIEVGGVGTTYTPTYFGLTTAGVTTYAANGQVGQYLRFGQWCFVSGRLSWTNATGTGAAAISLPFTSVNRTNFRAIFVVGLTSYTFTANTYVVGQMLENLNYFQPVECFNGIPAAALAIDVAATLTFSGFFEIA